MFRSQGNTTVGDNVQLPREHNNSWGQCSAANGTKERNSWGWPTTNKWYVESVDNFTGETYIVSGAGCPAPMQAMLRLPPSGTETLVLSRPRVGYTNPAPPPSDPPTPSKRSEQTHGMWSPLLNNEIQNTGYKRMYVTAAFHNFFYETDMLPFYEELIYVHLTQENNCVLPFFFILIAEPDPELIRFRSKSTVLHAFEFVFRIYFESWL